MPILTTPRSILPTLPEQGTWPWHAHHWPTATRWMERAQAEDDEDFLQLIPYALITGPGGSVWCYRRRGGDTRLDQRFSCGVGGHVDAEDAAQDLRSTLERSLRRELTEELGWEPSGQVLLPAAWIYEGTSPVGRVHLGLLYRLEWTAPAPPQPLPGEPLESLGFRPLTEILAEPRFELWSRLAAEFLANGRAGA